MKKNLKCMIAITLALMICIALLTAGALVNAANADKTIVDSVALKAKIPALAKGVWQGVDSNGDSLLFFVSPKHESVIRVSPENDTGIPVQYSYSESTGSYRVNIGYAGSAASWKLSENDGHSALLTTEDHVAYRMKYLCGDSVESFHFYDYAQLREKAQNYYSANIGDAEKVRFDAKMVPDGSGDAVVRVGCSDGSATVDYYTVNMVTGLGHNMIGNDIDFTQY